MQKIQNALDTLLSCSGGVDGKDCRATLLAALKYNLGVFQKELMDHLDHKELFFSAPVARKVSPLSLRRHYCTVLHSAASTGEEQRHVLRYEYRVLA